MSFQVVRSCAAVFTLAANEGPFRVVYFVHVSFQISFLFERFLTFLATEWPFTIVHQPVSLQQTSLSGGIIALVAQIRFFSGVSVNVPPQISLSSAGIITPMTTVWFRTAVYQQVSFHVVSADACVLTK